MITFLSFCCLVWVRNLEEVFKWKESDIKRKRKASFQRSFDKKDHMNQN